MEANITVTVTKTPKGNIRIKFKDGGNYLLQDTMENIGLIAAFQVEIDWANKETVKSDPL